MIRTNCWKKVCILYWEEAMSDPILPIRKEQRSQTSPYPIFSSKLWHSSQRACLSVTSGLCEPAGIISLATPSLLPAMGWRSSCTAKPTTAKVTVSPHAATVLVAPAALEGAHKQGHMSPQVEKPCLLPKWEPRTSCRGMWLENSCQLIQKDGHTGKTQNFENYIWEYFSTLLMGLIFVFQKVS